MGIESLLRQLKTIVERVTREMKLPVNMDNEMYEEEENLPLYREDEQWELDDGPEIEADRRDDMEPNRRKEQRYRAPEVYIMNLPDRSDEISRVPYILIQFLNGKDNRTSEDKGYELYATADVTLLIATYCLDGQAGGLQVVDIIERIRTVLMRGIVLAENYELMEPLDYQVYRDDTGRYYLGQMDTTWRMPIIRRDCLTIEEAAESGSLVGSEMLPEREGSLEDIWNEMTLRP